MISFELFVLIAVVALVLMGVIRLLAGKKGKQSESYFVPEDNKTMFAFESKGEKACRRHLEMKFRKPFPNCRPDFLRNPVTSTGNTAHNLELDCYNEEMKLSVEMQGVQHYKYSKFYHKNHEAFMNQKYRDEIKRSLCKQHGVTMIEVPYTVSIEDIPAYIDEALDRESREDSYKNES